MNARFIASSLQPGHSTNHGLYGGLIDNGGRRASPNSGAQLVKYSYSPTEDRTITQSCHVGVVTIGPRQRCRSFGTSRINSSNTPPLLAHLAARFVSQRENLATEALAYILSRSEAARSATIRTFRLLGVDLPDQLTFRTQAADADDAIPDLVGEDASRKQHLIVEAKFWQS